MKRSRVLAAVIVASASLIPGAARADEVTDWTEQMFRAHVIAATSPLNTTRSAAIVQTAIFDAVNGIEKKYAPIRVAPVKASFWILFPQTKLSRDRHVRCAVSAPAYRGDCHD